MTRLKIILFWKNLKLRLWGNYVILTVFLVLTFLTFISRYSYLLWLFFLIYVVRKDKLLGFIGLVISVAFFTNYQIRKNFKVRNENRGRVVQIVEFTSYTKVTIRSGAKFNVEVKNSPSLSPGMIVNYSLGKEEFMQKETPNGYDEKHELFKKEIFYKYKSDSITVERSGFSIYFINHYLKNLVRKHYDKETSSLINALVLGDYHDLKEEDIETLKENGIIHLFAISGLHISFLSLILTKILMYFKAKKSDVVISFIFLLYIVVCGFQPSIIRASMLYSLKTLEKYKKWTFSTVDRLSLIFLFLALFNPFYLYNLGFVFSFMMSGMIVLLKNKLEDLRPLAKLFYISFFAQLLSLPFVIFLNNRLNLLIPFLNIIFIVLMETVLLPLTLLTVALPFLAPLLKYTSNLFFLLSSAFGKIPVYLNFPKFHFLVYLSYYVLFFTLISYVKVKTFYTVMVFTVFSLAFVKVLDARELFRFYSLKNGEATVIKPPNSLGAIVIDTGDGRGKALTKELKAMGVYYLDALFISHGDLDHYGEIDELIKQFYIKTIYVSMFDETYYVKSPKSKRLKLGDVLKIKGFTVECLGPKSRGQTKNANSLILLFTDLKGERFLFTGDISKKEEEELSVNADVLKVSHHGSSTSTSPVFLKTVKPKVAIIMTGIKWQHKFPSKDTLDSLEKNKIKVYRTDIHSSIAYIKLFRWQLYKTMAG